MPTQLVRSKHANPVGQSIDPPGHWYLHDSEASSNDDPQKYESGRVKSSSSGTSTGLKSPVPHDVYEKQLNPSEMQVRKVRKWCKVKFQAHI